jgi:hypothetical protein
MGGFCDGATKRLCEDEKIAQKLNRDTFSGESFYALAIHPSCSALPDVWQGSLGRAGS